MTNRAESLIEALCDPCTSTAELTGMLGLDPKLIRIEKPSDPPRPWWLVVLKGEGEAERDAASDNPLSQ